MLGFIGTISGIIRIFYNISLSDNISIGIIAGGLYEKMITSGSGLIVGLLLTPRTISYNKRSTGFHCGYKKMFRVHAFHPEPCVMKLKRQHAFRLK